MSSPTTRSPDLTDQDVTEIAAIPARMATSWNRGDADGFAAPFTETADFVAFEGTHLGGRDEIAAFHRPLFATDLAGSRVEAEVRWVRPLDSRWALMHAGASVILPGEDEASPGRDSMQLFVATRRATGWMIEAMQNSRQLTLEHQRFLDGIDAAPPEARRRVLYLLATLTEP